MTATTALTVQNTTGVKDIYVIPSSFVEQQMEACLGDIGADVITTGMSDRALHSLELIEMTFGAKVCSLPPTLSRPLPGKSSSTKHKLWLSTPYELIHACLNQPTSSLTPAQVMVSTSGAQLLPHEAITGLSSHLLPLTTVLTPNLPEAKLILAEASRSGSGPPPRDVVESVADVEALGRQIRALGPQWVLVKGGHLPFRADMTVVATEAEREAVVDVLLGPDDYVLRIKSPWQESLSTHGTGCSLAGMTTAQLEAAHDMPLPLT